MSNDLRNHIYNNLNMKETDELVEIWQKNDRLEWSEDAFSVIEEILQERLEELPAQSEPIFEHEDAGKSSEIDPGILKDEKPPKFYKPRDIIRLEKWLNKAAIASIIASVISNVINLPALQSIVWSYFMDDSQELIAWLIALFVFAFIIGLQCIIIYFPLRALSSILKILMEMEFNSRGVEKTKRS